HPRSPLFPYTTLFRSGQILGEGLLGLRADDRIELFVLFVALHEAGAFERLGLYVVAPRWPVRKTEAVEAHAPLQWLATERADLTLFEIERGILLQLLIDDVLEFDRRQLEDVIRCDLFRCDLQLLLRKKSQIHYRLPYPNAN